MEQCKNLAAAGAVCDSVGFGLAFLFPFLGLPTSFAGVVCSGMGWKSGLTRAEVGLGLSIAGIAFPVPLSVLFAALMFSQA